MPAFLRPLLPLLFALGSLSCTGWPRGWNDAKRARTATGPGGAWIGTWNSQSTGHTGKLRCAVFPVKSATPPAPTAPKSRFKIQYNPQNHRLTRPWRTNLGIPLSRQLGPHPLCRLHRGLPCPSQSGRLLVRHRLPRPRSGIRGIFTHQATVDGDRLEAKYQSSADEGTLSLRRVGE